MISNCVNATSITGGTITSDHTLTIHSGGTANATSTIGTSYPYTYANGVVRDENEIRKAIERLAELTKENEFKMPTKNMFDFGCVYMAPAPIVPKIKKIETYNGKVVKVTFEDDTSERAVCSDVDVYSVDVGVTICILKKMLGKDGHKRYNKMMREVHKLMQKQVVEAAAERERKEQAKKKAERAREKAALRKAKAREDYIDAHVEALMRFNAKKNEKP